MKYPKLRELKTSRQALPKASPLAFPGELLRDHMLTRLLLLIHSSSFQQDRQRDSSAKVKKTEGRQ